MQEDGFVAEHEDAKEDPIYEYARTQHLYAEGIVFENDPKNVSFLLSTKKLNNIPSIIFQFFPSYHKFVCFQLFDEFFH